MHKNNSFYLLLILSLLFGFLIMHGCYSMYVQEGFENEEATEEVTEQVSEVVDNDEVQEIVQEDNIMAKPIKKENEKNNLDKKNTVSMDKNPVKKSQKNKKFTKKMKVKTLPF